MQSSPYSIKGWRGTPLAIAAGLSAAVCVQAADYSSAVLGDGPSAYYRFNDGPKSVVNRNSGSLGAAASATNLNVRTVSGAIAGSSNPAGYFNGTGARAIIPFQAGLNPKASDSFTVEAWVNTSVEVTDSPGPSPLMNRYSYSGVNRQGWVFFQRSPATGWNFRTYKGEGSSTGVNITGQASTPDAGKAGTWSHLAAVWDGPTSTARLYVNGEKVAEAEVPGGYMANTDDHDPAEAVRGPAGMSIGSYNNTEPGANAFHGKVDEFALYAKALSDQQILSHYQSGTNAARTVAYEDLIKSHGPAAYLRFDEPSADQDLAINLGTAGPEGDGINNPGVLHPAKGVVAGVADSANGFRPKGVGGGTTTIVPWSAKLNPEASTSFTIESWFYVAEEVTDSPGPSPLMNRYSYSGVNRQGWVYFQRSPTTGWNFRTYRGEGSSTGINITGQASTPDAGKAGTWNHVVTVWDGANTTAKMYVNGEMVAEGTGGYVANTNDHDPAEAVRGPAGLGIGSYNNTEPGANAFHGRVDEVAFYDYMLTPEQIEAHYKNAMDPKRTLPYEAAVLADKPVEYLRFDEPAFNPAANSGSLGEAANGALVLANTTAGPRGTALPGFESSNSAVALDGTNSFVNLGNPVGPVLNKQVTVSAWVNPAAVQGAVANIVARVPSISNEDDIYLRIVDGTTYEFGSVDVTEAGAEPRRVSAPVPSGDLSGTAWVHLAGVYDGTKWSLYRNGVLLGSLADTTGFPTGIATDWAVGGRGDGGAGRAFAGSIDEVAVFSKSLTAAQIKAHYDAAVTSSAVETRMTVTFSGGAVGITWTGGGVLQAADSVSGPFTDVAGAASPYAPAPSKAAQFFRVKR